MNYEGDIATIQRRLADTLDLKRRRLTVLDALAMQSGESALEVGCGGGALLPHFATAVGPAGRVVGIDISADQISAARRLCAGILTVETATEDVNRLSYTDASFDALVAVQVIEYLARPAAALAELRRVARPHGRLLILSTIWDTVFWNCGAPDLTVRVQSAWRQHAPHPNLPAALRPLLEGAKFHTLNQTAVSIVNNAYHEDAFAYWAARLIVAFATGRRLLSEAEAAGWLRALEKAQEDGEFFFSSTAVLTTAIAT